MSSNLDAIVYKLFHYLVNTSATTAANACPGTQYIISPRLPAPTLTELRAGMTKVWRDHNGCHVTPTLTKLRAGMTN